MFRRRETKPRITSKQRVKGEGIRRFEPLAARIRRVALAVAIMLGCVSAASAAAMLGKMIHYFTVQSDYFRLETIETKKAKKPENVTA